ncbi:MAG TPA: hemerythrin domain-containing protein [Thermoanaerobaculia bacterium]|jgi:hemerythrin superfamily protein
MPNAIDLLRADHDRLRQILPKLGDASIAAEERKRFLTAIEKELKIHTLLEEEIFYPAYKDAARTTEDRDMYFEAIEEHHVVDMLLPELQPLDASSDGFRAKASVLRELVEHHAGEEEEDMFPKAQQLLGDQRLADLGQSMNARKQELEQQWENGGIAALLRKVQSIADKFAPTAVKDARVEANRDDARR